MFRNVMFSLALLAAIGHAAPAAAKSGEDSRGLWQINIGSGTPESPGDGKSLADDTEANFVAAEASTGAGSAHVAISLGDGSIIE